MPRQIDPCHPLPLSILAHALYYRYACVHNNNLKLEIGHRIKRKKKIYLSATYRTMLYRMYRYVSLIAHIHSNGVFCCHCIYQPKVVTINLLCDVSYEFQFLFFSPKKSETESFTGIFRNSELHSSTWTQHTVVPQVL